MIVKICGLTREEDVSGAIAAGADMLGFITGVPESPRNNTRNRLDTLLEAGKSCERAILFRNHPLEKVVEICTELQPEFVHFCGNEDEAYRGSFRDSCAEIRIMQTIGVPLDRPDDLSWLKRCLACLEEQVVHHTLLDASLKGLAGGTGQSFAFDQVRDSLGEHHDKVLISGGLNPENLLQALRSLQPKGVDVSGGVEASKGVKDESLMRRFVKLAKVEFQRDP